MKHYTKDNFHPTTSVGFSLVKARNVVIAEMDAVLKGLDITAQQMGIILCVGRGIATTPFELSKMLEIDSGLMTRMLDKLEKQGLLARERSVEDRRSVNLGLTEQGVATMKEIPKVAPEALNRRLKDFTQEEFLEFHRLLEKFLQG
ncbi:MULTISPECIES: MarR family winged helix-turn-helix transcriptional regulator [unclassified Herbaspirillum]|uniref:MarR family winged helix-turn-helix transcriptional regulator n=1 Tax=unclassified Herbaspirillum TaxID=2624150 RepID=UPI00383BDA83